MHMLTHGVSGTDREVVHNLDERYSNAELVVSYSI